MIETVKEHYDIHAQDEWNRLKEHPYEFIFTTYEMDRFIEPGDSILDIGGGPGRYSIHYARKGHPVTLVDLSEGNIRLAKAKARQYKTKIQAFVANCLDLEDLDLGLYDHVFLMGPLYHLLNEEERIQAVKLACNHLKPGGKLYVSFILGFAGVIYDLKNPGCLPIDLDPTNAVGAAFTKAVIDNKDFAGRAFTDAFFIAQYNIESFMSKFPLRKEILFGQEGILAPNEKDLLKRSKKERDLWVAFAKRFLGVDYLLPYSEHAMWIGTK
jgi:2-polyprenyl-3-methyl-5-hydroxy-6-metoxy-1,4-benzoquinol methylase